jgi:trigger factor
MSTGEQDLESPVSTADASDEATLDPSGEPSKVKLDLGVEISDVGPCKKHVKVSIPRSDIDRQFEESLGTMTREASVPGFRPGHAPKQLVERRFRKQVAGQVKSVLIMAALEQLDKGYDLEPISQPQLDPEAIEMPDEGPLRFEFDVEVRPQLTLPTYKGLTAKRPVKTITEADIDDRVKAFLERQGQLIPKLEGGAEPGDFVTADITFHVGGETLNTAREIQFRLQPELRFGDGTIPKLGEALKGVTPGETREAEGIVGGSSPNLGLRGRTIGVTFLVHDLKSVRLPEVTPAFLDSIGVSSKQELRDALKESLERQLKTRQQQAVRREIMDQLLANTPFDLPEDLVKRQEATTIRRLVMELRQGGFTDEQIRASEARLRADAHASTLRSLKEFFLLAKIAEAESIEVKDDDLEDAIEAMAAESDESTRRVRARIEKEGLAEAIYTQVLERKTLDLILESVQYEDVPLVPEHAVETLDQSASTAEAGEAETPETGTETETEAEAETEPQG